MFGDGVIVKLEVTEYEAIATINFVDEGQKTLDLSWAPVRKIKVLGRVNSVQIDLDYSDSIHNGFKTC